MIGRIHVYHFLIWCLRNARGLANMMNITVYSQSWCCNFQPNPWHVVLNIWKSTFNFRTILIMTPQWDSFSKSCIILFTKRPKKCEVPLVPRWGGGSSGLSSLSLPQRPNNWVVSNLQGKRLNARLLSADFHAGHHSVCNIGQHNDLQQCELYFYETNNPSYAQANSSGSTELYSIYNRMPWSALSSTYWMKRKITFPRSSCLDNVLMGV